MRIARICLSAFFSLGLLDVAGAADIGIASFNLAWAGTTTDFNRHAEVCSAPAVQWCDTRAKKETGAQEPTSVEEARAKQCQIDFDKASGGPLAGMSVAPCNAYKLTPKKVVGGAANLYLEKLQGLKETVHTLVAEKQVQIFAFQEVKSVGVIREILGVHAAKFDTCLANHSAFQTVGFAWVKTLSSAPASCVPESSLSIKEKLQDSTSLRTLRPGLSLELTVEGQPLTIMNVHLKSSCANLITGGGFPGRLLTDKDSACQVLNRQVAPLESWIERVAAKSPRFVLLGDFNRRLDEEAKQKVPVNKVRVDGTDPAGVNRADADGQVASKYLWQEISDGNPSLHQVLLDESAVGCKGFVGLDHILLSSTLRALQPAEPRSVKLPVAQKAGQKIVSSDHCPRVTVLKF
ncbi:MAG TPA: hypothetical protein VE934_08725 [Polaromonas sp.]|uniref:endonuclease/exonuclease/phosphatase family protein n=1 Tax=Polaromonas sp. TaxID=1869339 RepID=UPI002D31AD57|nr:hypothetical protein [Polaromonas sp.]HYW57032.1 hypothetical protein [Polaromonas sp.]